MVLWNPNTYINQYLFVYLSFFFYYHPYDVNYFVTINGKDWQSVYFIYIYLFMTAVTLCLYFMVVYEEKISEYHYLTIFCFFFFLICWLIFIFYFWCVFFTSIQLIERLNVFYEFFSTNFTWSILHNRWSNTHFYHNLLGEFKFEFFDNNVVIHKIFRPAEKKDLVEYLWNRHNLQPQRTIRVFLDESERAFALSLTNIKEIDDYIAHVYNIKYAAALPKPAPPIPAPTFWDFLCKSFGDLGEGLMKGKRILN